MKQFKKVRTLADIKNDPRVVSIHREEDFMFSGKFSWWCYLKTGWQDAMNPTCHTIHERTLKEVCWLVNESIPFPEDPEL